MDTLKLKSKTEEIFEIKKEAASLSTVIKDMCEVQDDTSEPIQFCEISSDVLKKIIDYCHYHFKNPPPKIQRPLKNNNLAEVVSPWDVEFINLENTAIFELMNAANFLSIEPLLDLACAKIACSLKGKSPEEIRNTFGIVNDFTPEEERQVREENRWCEDL